ncbi:hypothetical protein ADK67_37400 [Saccharothrix sp. NRRL B-16348]|uniref:protein DpdH n=1 Tax=Saccharothrix sp. NRRL B-16348 TaxID=1415542 RepID=UPI0006AFC10A|nr:protein DpdH [Saccharothrix sp. NRRL B-16348]KOX17972.1 hypothetical protein ADK67_37400 [Saccharothrix sp. NRRL B-16348]
MSGNLVCWERGAIAFATQVDVGGLELGDERAEAVFSSIHHSLPLNQVRDVKSKQSSDATEQELLRAFTRPVEANEPLLVFVTGHKGTGKSHLVRWLKSQIGPQPTWHIVYIEKRNTNLRRVIERILDGIDTPRAGQLREALAKAGSEIASDEEAMNALLARLDHLVTFDRAVELKELSDLTPAELADLRARTHRLLGDFTFRAELSKPGGPVHRIVRLARGGAGASETDEEELHLTEQDLMVDPARFEDAGRQFQSLVQSVVATKGLRTDIAVLCDSYLERAKAEVFTGPSTDLLEVFEDVRKEIAARNQELCLFVEDLVLLHGIDKQLAQALTVPADSQLCKLRAAIAVTDGYLASVDTFADRGVHFRIDVNPAAIGASGLRDFVGRYLNVGRLSEEKLLARSDEDDPNAATANACKGCPVREQCHETFGTSSLGHGLYPFNGIALDRLVELASAEEFKPREILRQVIRASLDTAEEELPVGGVFPSDDFARTLDGKRQAVPVETRTAVRRHNKVSPQAELSLRAFYAENPPAVDADVQKIAHYLGVRLSALEEEADEVGGETEAGEVRPDDKNDRAAAPPETTNVDEFEKWAAGGFLSTETAHKIRTWICETTVAYLQEGPYGLPIGRMPKGSGKTTWRVGSYEMRYTDIDIDKAAGAGALKSENPFRIEVNDENALMLRGVLEASKGAPLDAVDGGTWFFSLQARIARYADSIARLARSKSAAELSTAVRALTVLRNAAPTPGTTVGQALPAMLAQPVCTNAAAQSFLRETRSARDRALTVLRNHATTAKGGGKPSLVDVGLVYPEIQACLKVRSFDSREIGDDGEMLQNLQVKLERATKRAWTELRETIAALERLIDPGEDLAATMRMVQRLVDQSHDSGKLPSRNTQAVYNAAAEKVKPAMMTLYRKLAKVVASPGTEDLWEVRDDPMPKLQALHHYADVTNKVLFGLEASLTESGAGGAAVDTEELIGSLRGLADAMDAVTGLEKR